MKESLASTSFARFKNNIASYVSVGVLCGLFFVLLTAFCLIDEMMLVVAVPVLALPFLFASHISCYLLSIGEPIRLRAFFHYFVSFFRPQFRGSFRGITSFLKCLAIYSALLLVFYFVLYLVYRQQYGNVFLESVTNLVNQYMSGASYEELVATLNANDGMLLTFMMYVSSFPLPFAVAGFMYWISFNSISLYYRANINNGTPSLMRLAIANAYGRYRRSLRKDWFKLNWLIIVLPLIGSAIGALIYFLVVKNPIYLPTLLNAGAFIPYIFFLPFYFPNMEVLYTRYENIFKEGNKMAIEAFLERIQSSIELSEEEKRNLEESFRNNNDEKE